MDYYVDTCIWLNLFKKETDKIGKILYWQIAKNFIEQINKNNDVIIVSTIVLKELYFQTGAEFTVIKQFFNEMEFIQIIKTTCSDYDLAREFEQQHKILSFYDYIHLAIAKRLKITLITRDKALINFANNHIKAYVPEELIC